MLNTSKPKRGLTALARAHAGHDATTAAIHLSTGGVGLHACCRFAVPDRVIEADRDFGPRWNDAGLRGAGHDRAQGGYRDTKNVATFRAGEVVSVGHPGPWNEEFGINSIEASIAARDKG